MNWLRDTYDITYEPDKADIFMFCGGSDISPRLYNAKKNVHTGYIDYARDMYEVSMFNMAMERNLSIIGICRGAQLACAMAGGTLIQHMRHPGSHMIKTYDGKEMLVNSMHHQMQWPYSMGENFTGSQWNYEVLGWAENVSNQFYFESLDESTSVIAQHDMKEPEIVLYPVQQCLGIQYHPEFFDAIHGEAKAYTKNMIIRHVNQNLYSDAYKTTK